MRLGKTSGPVPAEGCGECTLCCKVLAVDDLGKAKDRWCPHAAKKQGCRIYETRPDCCRAFRCLWLDGLVRTGPQFRPDRLHGVLTVTTDGENLVLHEDPGYRGHARRQLNEVFVEFISDGEHYVIVVCGEDRQFYGAPDVYRRKVAEGE